MERKVITQENTEEILLSKKARDLSLLKNKRNREITSKISRDLDLKNSNIKNTVSFPIKFDKVYRTKYRYYINEELNSELLLMLFKYINISDIISISIKNNIYFIKEFIYIMYNLLIDNVDFVIITLILDKIGWVNEGQEPWKHIFYICLTVKIMTSTDSYFLKSRNKINKLNKKFLQNYRKWKKNFNIDIIIKNIKLTNINKRYKEFKHHIYLNQYYKKYINYNEIAKEISKIPLISRAKKKVNLNILNTINSNSNSNINNENNENSNYLIDKQSLGFSRKSLDTLQIQNMSSFPEKLRKASSQIKHINKNKVLLNAKNSNTYIPFLLGDEDLYKNLSFLINK